MQILKNMARPVAALMLLFSASVAHADSESTVHTVVESLNSTWNQHFNNANLVALTTMYAEDAILSPGDGSSLSGRAEIQNLFSGFIDNGLHGHSIEIIDSFQEGNMITQISRWQVYGKEVNGEKPVYGGILVSVLKRDDSGHWKTHLHLWNMSS